MNNGVISNFHAADNSASFKFKQKITSVTAAGAIKDFEIMVPLKCLTNFWKTVEMLLINCEINLILTRFKNLRLMQIQKQYKNLILQETSIEMKM